MRLITREQGEECLSGSTILCNIRRVQTLVDHAHEKVHGEDGFPCPRTSLNNDRSLLIVNQTLRHRPHAHVETNRLFIQKREFRHAIDHGRQCVLQGFRGPDSSVLNQVQKIAARGLFLDELLYEGGKLPGLVADEERCRSIPFLVDFG